MWAHGTSNNERQAKGKASSKSDTCPKIFFIFPPHEILLLPNLLSFNFNSSIRQLVVHF